VEEFVAMHHNTKKGGTVYMPLLPVNAKPMSTPANNGIRVSLFMHGLRRNVTKMTVWWNYYFGRSYRHSGHCCENNICWLEDAKRFLMHYWQLFGRSLTLRSQSPSARKLASVIATVFVEIRSK
jgi:hypothetical protein